jgi:hypothetical protein
VALSRLQGWLRALVVCLASVVITSAGASEISHVSGIQVMQGSQYKFADPLEIYAVAGRLWINNADSNELTIVSAPSGNVDRILDPGQYHLWLGGVPLTVVGNDVWTLGYKTGYKTGYLLNLLVELNGSTGAIIERSTSAPSTT